MAKRFSSAKGSMQILVVDDNADAATLLSMYLRKLGHSVRVAHDGLTALDDARTPNT